MNYAYIRPTRKVSLKTQQDSLSEHVRNSDYVLVEGKQDLSVYALVQKQDGAPPLLCKGFTLFVFRYDLLAQPKKKKGDRMPRKSLREITDGLIRIGVNVVEVETGRNWKDHGIEMYADAVDRLAGNNGTSNKRGRPKKHDYSDEECEHIKLLWGRSGLKNAEQRVASVQAKFPAFKVSTWYTLKNAGKV